MGSLDNQQQQQPSPVNAEAVVSFPRWWVEQIRDGLAGMGKLPSGPLGDWAFLFREQLNDALNEQPVIRAQSTCCQGLAPSSECRCEQERLAQGHPPYQRVGIRAQQMREPVAWLYEIWCGEDCWSQRYTDTKPAGNKWERNIRPLYLDPPPAATQQTPDLELIERELEQAQDCIRGETPEDVSDEEARNNTIDKIRDALRSIDPAGWGGSPFTSPDRAAREGE